MEGKFPKENQRMCLKKESGGRGLLTCSAAAAKPRCSKLEHQDSNLSSGGLSLPGGHYRIHVLSVHAPLLSDKPAFPMGVAGLEWRSGQKDPLRN